jgi:hypothetical protein
MTHGLVTGLRRPTGGGAGRNTRGRVWSLLQFAWIILSHELLDGSECAKVAFARRDHDHRFVGFDAPNAALHTRKA